MRNTITVVSAVTLLGHTSALASPPPPISPTLHSFPGAHAHPPTARSAGLALSDRWLAGGPWDNPALAGGNDLVLGGSMSRTSRQDLRRQNREFEDQSFFLDVAGGAIGFGAGTLGASLYLSQPLLRLEDNAFVSGQQAAPATFVGSTKAREARAGVAVAWNGGGWRAGAAAEWTQRDDRYEIEEQSGAPTAGTTVAEFSGDGVGGVVGASFRFGGAGRDRYEVGAGYRMIPAIEVEGEQTSDLTLGSSSAPIAAEREASWEGGFTVRVTFTPAFQGLASLGGHGDQAWEGFDVTRGPGSEWSLGGEYHDQRDAWVVRFGFGMEEESGVPEPRASRIGLGVAWLLDTTRLEVGVLHRSIQRPGEPDSGDDRIVVTLVQAL